MIKERIHSFLLRAKQIIPQRLKRPSGVVCCVVLLLTSLAGIFNPSFFTSEYDTASYFIPENHSNPIIEGTPTQINFTAPRLGVIHTIRFRFVCYYEQGFENPVEFALYDGQGSLIQKQTLWPGSLAADESYATVELDNRLEKGADYSVVLTSAVTDIDLAYRIAFGENEFGVISSWTWGEQVEPGMPDISIVYTKFDRTFFLMFLACLLLGLLAVLVPPFKKRWSRAAYICAALVVTPMPILYVVELLNTGTFEKIRTVAILLNYLLYLCVLVLLFALSNRLSVAVVGGGSFLLLFGVVNYYVLVFRGMVISPTDIFAITTAASVAGDYTLFFSWPLLLCLAVWALVLCVGLQGQYRLKRARYRLPAILMALLFTLSMGYTTMDENMYRRFGLEVNKYRQTEQSKTNGFYLNFAMNSKDLAKVKPSGYNVAQLTALVGAEAELQVAAYSADEEKTPHIIVIMNESLADFSIVGETGATQDPLPFIHSLADNEDTFLGNISVSVFGGGTNTSEFEVLTGFSLAFENGSTSPYYQFMRGELASLTWNLGELGYNVSAMHPESPTNWNRNRAYPLLGFESMYFREDFEGWSSMVRQHISDASTYELITNLYEARGDEPLFIFNVTMQNHGPYTVETYEPSIGVEWDPEGYSEAAQYLSIANESDRAFRELIEYFEAEDEPVLIVMFGDHWPAFGDGYLDALFGQDFTALEGYTGLLLYTTPLVMWSNYGADFSAVENLANGHTSTGYLSAVIKQAADIPLTVFDEFRLRLMEQYPVISSHGILDAEGNFYEAEGYADLSEEMRLYGYMVYNGMLDEKNRVEELFALME